MKESLPITGTTISHYRITKKLGAGGMGEVYLAQDTQLERKVAIKLLPPDSIPSEQARKRLVREAQAAAALDHPNICAIHEVGEEGSHTFIVMQYVEGETLDCRMKRQHLGLDEALTIAAQLADALSEAHAHGIIHRDIKPSNVIITPRGQAKVMDFGLARVVAAAIETEAETQSLLTSAGTIMGTVPYMSPEQVNGAALDSRSDIFSLGVVLYEMLSGRQPFACESKAASASAILTHEPPPLARYSEDLPAEAERIVRKCLVKDRERRYQTMRDVAIDLENVRRERESMEIKLSHDGQAAARADVHVIDQTAGWRVPFISRRVLVAATLIAPLVIATLVYALLVRNASAPRQPEIKSLAVLPLANLSGDPAQDYFADGMTEALITELAQIGGLRVISRTSVMQYKGARKAMPEIARELSVDAVVEGSVQRSGERVQITAQLIRAAADQHLWAKSYERDLRDVLSLQREVARGIASEIRVKVSPQEQERLASGRPVQRNALEAYLRGRDYFNQGIYGAAERGLLEKSIGYYQQAINIDPDYAPAYAGMGRAYHWLATGDRAPEVFPKAKEAALKALQLDETLAEAHGALAVTLTYLDWDLAGAEREYKRAIELNPSYSEAHHGYATYLLIIGRLDEAIREIEQAETLDPLVKQLKVNKTWIYTRARQYDRAIKQAESLGLSQDDPFLHQLLGTNYIYKKEYERGLAELQKVVALSAGSPDSKASLAWAYATANRKGEALKLLNELKHPAQPGPAQPVSLSLIYTALGDKDEAFVWLEKGYQAHTEFFLDNINSADFESLHSDPRFQNIIQRIGFPQMAV